MEEITFTTPGEEMRNHYFHITEWAAAQGLSPIDPRRPMPIPIVPNLHPDLSDVVHQMLILSGEFAIPWNPNHWLHPVVTEMLSNLYQMGATLVEVKRTSAWCLPQLLGFTAPLSFATFYEIRMRSNLTYHKDQVAEVLANINSQTPHSTKNYLGGTGIRTARKTLADNAQFSRLSFAPGPLTLVGFIPSLNPHLPWDNLSGIETVILYGGEVKRKPWPDDL